jgi:hypothetical protein
MNFQLRRQRNGYWLFLGLLPLALLNPVPLLNAQTKPAPKPVPVLAMETPRPDFDKADRNKDGFVDKSEAGVVQGLSANFERADRNRDGKLDRGEFERGLALVGQK